MSNVTRRLVTRRFVAGGLPLIAVAAPTLVHAAPAPAFTAKDIDGKARSLSEFRGKTVVLEWVNEGCRACSRRRRPTASSG
jgi:hypothetical protein